MKSVIKVGIFATICLIVLGLLIWKIEDFNPFEKKGQRIDAVFRTVAGLDDKASVRIAGVKVGHVDGVGLQGSQARITLALDKKHKLTVGTSATIANLGLLGEKYVELIPGPPDAPPLPPDAVLTTKLQPSADNLNRISGKVVSGQGTIGKLVNDEKAYNDVISTLDSIKGGVDTLSGTLGAINKFKIDLDLQAYYLTQREKVAGESQNALNSFKIDIDPEDKKHLYRVGLVSSPEG